MAEQQKFCTACGCNVPEGAQYCPECGRPLEGSEAQAKQAEMTRNMETMYLESRRNFLTFALSIYAFPAVIFGLLAILDAGHTAHVIWNNVDFQHYIQSHGWDITEETIKNAVLSIGAVEVVSGLCAGVSLYFVYKGVKRKIATILCIVAAALCTWSLLGVFLGMMMALNIHGEKDLFSDE